jgi:hypothetical protein
MAFVARNGIYLARAPRFAADPFDTASAATPATPVDYSGLVQAIASGEMRFASACNMQLYSATSNIVLGAGAARDVITVSSNVVVINADVRVRGSVDSYTSTEVNIVDKVLRVAYPQPSNAPVGVADLDGAGLQLADAAVAANYEKSVKWRSGLAADAPPAQPASEHASASNESFWELRGGHLRITRPRADPSSTVSYGLRINERDELEFYKASLDPAAGATTYQRVFTMGSAAEPGITLPTSTNFFFQ